MCSLGLIFSYTIFYLHHMINACFTDAFTSNLLDVFFEISMLQITYSNIFYKSKFSGGVKIHVAIAIF